jgi:hypothetical protein
MYFSVAVYLPFPLKLISTYYFVGKTQRRKMGLAAEDFVELCLSALVAAWVYFRYYLNVFDYQNKFIINDPSLYSSG